MSTEGDVQRWLWTWKHSSYSVMVPNYSPIGWHECDMFAVTKAGYFHEFEIKLSASDFRADAAKRSHDTYARGMVEDGQYIPRKRIEGKRKHDRIGAGDEKGPSRFFFVMPKLLVPENEVPSWAGLIWCLRCDDRKSGFELVREAPKLHGAKVRKDVLRHAINCCYWRFWNARQDIWRLQERLAMVETRANSQMIGGAA